MMSAHTVFVKGPMHPDLFDGETPIMLAMNVEEACDVFSVGVEYQITDEEDYLVLAANEEEAGEIAAGLFLTEHGCDAEVIDTTARAVDKQSAAAAVTEEMITQYQNYKAIA